MLTSITLSSFIFALLLTFATAARNYAVRYKELACKSLPPTIESFECKIELDDQNFTSLTANLVPGKNLYMRDVHVEMYLIRDSRQFSAINTTLDACEFLKKGSEGALMQLTFKELMNASNFFSVCPFIKGKLYYMKKFRIDAEKFPTFVPQLDAVTKLVVREEGKVIIDYKSVLEFTPKNKQKATPKQGKQPKRGTQPKRNGTRAVPTYVKF